METKLELIWDREKPMSPTQKAILASMADEFMNEVADRLHWSEQQFIISVGKD